MNKKRLPDFIIAGAPKCGTTSLIKYLNESPQSFCITELENGSEPHFFSKNYEKGLEWYRGLFIDSLENKLLGEKSVSYLIHPKAAERIHNHIPEVKLIFVLRNPVDRAFSQYKANYQRGTEFFSFKSAIRQEKMRHLFFKNNYSYARRGQYSRYLRPFFKYFSKDQMYFILFEDFIYKTVREMEKPMTANDGWIFETSCR